MSKSYWLAALLVFGGLTLASCADEPKVKPPLKRLLLVTDSGGFVHDSVGLASAFAIRAIPTRPNSQSTPRNFAKKPA
jgi:hypothetical protein